MDVIAEHVRVEQEGKDLQRMRFGAQLPFDKAGNVLALNFPVVCTVVAPFDVERVQQVLEKDKIIAG